MTIYSLQGDYLSECTYIVAEDGNAIVIDPGTSAERILDACKSISITLRAVLLTHGHADHTIGAHDLQKAGLPIYAHTEEFSVIAGRASLALALGLKQDSFIPDVALVDDQELQIADLTVKVIYTPGHTQGGVCYLIGDALFTGDTLFPGGYGRADFPTGDEQDLLCSIANVLFELPPETKVYSGHADVPMDLSICLPQTTIVEEYSTNPILCLL